MIKLYMAGNGNPPPPPPPPIKEATAKSGKTKKK